ncbi:lipoprotein LpqV [Mycolicibacterium confluentis]|uniref:LpqV protein n=1 Tax=Mycolicibacterium confluentis TaxID=28047 RepID=A0A7I7XSE5_9MYCO|nr:lipoprotein LpqV [Mycolicibacterium confluentis]MCV7321387.1 lipoprotein LpqV [Mycolicibacterium confluentis]ORV33070.1 hypothetical protein AWB99_08625 [Mycolicibacterium confluentis]BBZ32131.1 LpqV protein [Mycolicibacterium confluentis]
MRRNSTLLVFGVAATSALMSAGCASDQDHTAATSTTTTTAEWTPLPPEPTPPDAVGVSPGGVTTRVDVPSDAEESQYGQACLAAKTWMDAQGGDPTVLVEPYLQVLQQPGFQDPGNFNTPWAELTPAQQAGVILAVNGAAEGQCG